MCKIISKNYHGAEWGEGPNGTEVHDSSRLNRNIGASRLLVHHEPS